MEASNGDNKSITFYIRNLHRDIGYLLLGLTIVYALSGLVLVYRETDFLKSSVLVEKTLSPQMSIDDIARNLHLRRLEVTKTEGEVIHFQGGSAFQDGVYNRITGAASFVERRLPVILQIFIRFHKVSNSNFAHWFAVLYGILLLFLAISSLWMFKPGTRQFRRGIVVSGIGMITTIAILSIFV